MNTLRAEADTAYERLRCDMRSDMARLREDIAKRETNMAVLREDIAKRETRLILAVGGMIATGVVILGLLMG